MLYTIRNMKYVLPYTCEYVQCTIIGCVNRCIRLHIRKRQSVVNKYDKIACMPMQGIYSCVVKAFEAKWSERTWNVPRSSSDPGLCLVMLASCEPEYTKICMIRMWNTTGLILVLSDRHLELIRARYPFWKESDSFFQWQRRRGKRAICMCDRIKWPNDRFQKMHMSSVFLMHKSDLQCMHARGRENPKTSNLYFCVRSCPAGSLIRLYIDLNLNSTLMISSVKTRNVGPLITEPPFSKKRVCTGALKALDDPSLVQTKFWRKVWVSVNSNHHSWCCLIWWHLPIARYILKFSWFNFSEI